MAEIDVEDDRDRPVVLGHDLEDGLSDPPTVPLAFLAGSVLSVCPRLRPADEHSVKAGQQSPLAETEQHQLDHLRAGQQFGRLQE